MLSVLTVNIGAAARLRAEAILLWLASRPEDVFILTETSAGTGTSYLLDQFRDAGYAVVHAPDSNGDRGTALVSRVPVVANLGTYFAGVSIPGRVASALLATEPAVSVLGIYVPSRDRSLVKTEKKQQFVRSLLAAIDGLPDDLRAGMVVGGDYNVIARTHRPLHSGFFAFEFGLLEAFEDNGFTDAFAHCSPGEQVYSWIGRTGDGYRYDYIHVGQVPSGRIATCVYLHETRDLGLTDHAAVTLQLDVMVPTSLTTTDPTEVNAAGLF